MQAADVDRVTAEECLVDASFELDRAVGLALEWQEDVLPSMMHDHARGEATRTGAAGAAPPSKFEVAFAAFAPDLVGNRRSGR